MENNNINGSPWPRPGFRFLADLGDDLKGVAFQVVSGMDTEEQQINHRNPSFPPVKIPVMPKYGNVTLKKGVFVNDNTFWNWHARISMNTLEKRTIIIRLLNDEEKIIGQWELHKAVPTKITGADLRSDGNEVAVDALEIMHEEIKTSNG